MMQFATQCKKVKLLRNWKPNSNKCLLLNKLILIFWFRKTLQQPFLIKRLKLIKKTEVIDLTTYQRTPSSSKETSNWLWKSVKRWNLYWVINAKKSHLKSVKRFLYLSQARNKRRVNACSRIYKMNGLCKLLVILLLLNCFRIKYKLLN